MKKLLMMTAIFSLLLASCDKEEILTTPSDTTNNNSSTSALQGTYCQTGWIDEGDTNWIDMSTLVDTFKYVFYNDFTFDYEYISFENGLLYTVSQDTIILDGIDYTYKLSANEDTLYLGGWIYDWSIFVKE